MTGASAVTKRCRNETMQKEKERMRCLVAALAALATIVLPVWAQRIEVQKPDPARIVRVETALNHLTVIEVREPVTTVAAGSPAFKIEWRENKVFIQPTEADVATNLFIWTASGRLSYELEPAGPVDKMDFAIDQPPPSLAPTVATAAKPHPSAATDAVPPMVLLGGRPIRTDGLFAPKNRVVVFLKDTFQNKDNELFIRYAVVNNTREAYTLTTPEVYLMNVEGSRLPLDQWSNWQIAGSAASRIERAGETPVKVVGGNLRTVRVDPGQETVGVVGVKLPVRMNGPTVLRLVFPQGRKGRPTAILVL